MWQMPLEPKVDVVAKNVLVMFRHFWQHVLLSPTVLVVYKVEKSHADFKKPKSACDLLYVTWQWMQAYPYCNLNHHYKLKENLPELETHQKHLKPLLSCVVVAVCKVYK